MFTGLIEEIGHVLKVQPISGGKRIKISAEKIMDDVKVDDSVCVNGVCLTATGTEPKAFWTDAVGATLSKSTLLNIREGAEVNLERSVRLMDRLGGHLVLGHVNGIAKITQIKKLGENYYLEVSIPDELKKYVIDEGSIAIDGVSLTIANLSGNNVGISVIPHTWKTTSFKNNKVGDDVNIETDVIAKYVEKLLTHRASNEGMDSKEGEGNGDKFTDSWFKQMGY